MYLLAVAAGIGIGVIITAPALVWNHLSRRAWRRRINRER